MMGITPAAFTFRGDVLAGTSVLAIADNTLGVLYGHLACSLHEEDCTYGDCEEQEDFNYEHDETALAAGGTRKTACEFVEERSRKTCNDTYKDDEGDTIADAAVCNALTEPHDEHGAGCKDYCKECQCPEAHGGTACGGAPP